VYDLFPIQLYAGGLGAMGGEGVQEQAAVILKSSLLVPPLLALWYAVMGCLFVLADDWVKQSARHRDASGAVERSRGAGLPPTTTGTACLGGKGLPGVALAFGLLAANLELSALLYDTFAAPPAVIGPVLAATALASWWVADGTRQGLVLAAVCGAGAPLAELVLMGTTHCWHYAQVGDGLLMAFSLLPVG
jgi:endoplasmic reticulum chaperone BiP